MRSFIVSLILLALVLGVICINSIYVCRATSELSELAKAISEEPDVKKIKSLAAKWESCKPVLELSINENKIEQMSELITSLRYDDEAKKYCLLIVELCEELSENEKFSLRGIF